MPLASPPRAPEYQYSPLNVERRMIRLIKLRPPVVSYIPHFQATICLEITETPVKLPRAYDALSYVWGAGSRHNPDRRVIVDTPSGIRELRINKHLETALLHLAAAESAHRLLFVDQLSINQSDQEEKANQVQMMHNVYTNCERVVVWLGPGSKASDRWFDLTYDICLEGVLSRFMIGDNERFTKVFDAVMDPNFGGIGAVKEDRDDILGLLSQHGSKYPIDGLSDILRRPWFSRLWTIQEACLPPAVTFVCGTKKLCFDCFRSGTLFYMIYNNYWLSTVQDAVSQREIRLRSEVFNLTGGLSRIFQERKAIHTLQAKHGLYDALLKYNVNDGGPKIGATLPEDRLFGLLGLVAPGNPVLRVRYGDVVWVYTELAAALLAQGKLDVLLFAQFPKRIAGLPTWVPDWSMDLKMPHGYANLTSPVFKAGFTRDPVSPPRYGIDLGSLTVEGFLIDRILRIGTVGLRVDLESQGTVQVDYRAIYEYLQEIDAFLLEAGANPLCPFPYSFSERTRTHCAARLSDGGLTEKYLAHTLGSPSAAAEKLLLLHEQAVKWGRKLISIDELTRSYRLDRIIRTVGVVPSYAYPRGTIDILRQAAVDPANAAVAYLRGMAMLVADMAGVFAAWATMALVPWLLRVRRRFAGVRLMDIQKGEALSRVGLVPELMVSTEMSEYRGTLMRLIGRRLFLTERGYVGVGPGEMAADDGVAVIFGASVPMILRKRHDIGVEETGGLWEVKREEKGWTLVGEAYCDGIMEGKAVEGSHGTRYTFTVY